MNDKTLEYDLKEHIDNGCIIISLNGHLNYLNSDGTTCPVEEETKQPREV
jgi:hypothetical protein